REGLAVPGPSEFQFQTGSGHSAAHLRRFEGARLRQAEGDDWPVLERWRIARHPFPPRWDRRLLRTSRRRGRPEQRDHRQQSLMLTFAEWFRDTLGRPFPLPAGLQPTRQRDQTVWCSENLGGGRLDLPRGPSFIDRQDYLLAGHW